MLEEERKFEVDPRFAVPDLGPALPSGGRVVAVPAVPLRATYYDTEDLRLARSGASLRFRRGDREPWTAKLPTEVAGVRIEVSRPGKPTDLPDDLLALLTRYTRGAAVRPSVLLRTKRTVYELRDPDGRLLAEVDDDTVAVLEDSKVRQRFREVEVERHEGGAKLLGAVARLLVDAGARPPESFVAKHVRALGELPPADFPISTPMPDKPSAGDVVTAAIRADIGRILDHDPLVRLRLPLPDGDTAVHQMRVGCRRLRSDLKTFRALLDPEWTRRLRDEVKWLADLLGAVRDAEVLRARLHDTAAADPVAELDEASVARIDTELAARYEEALSALDAALRDPRYHALLDSLIDAAREPRLVRQRAKRRADVLLPRLASKPWRALAFGREGASGAGELRSHATDHEWHEVRIRAKRARYAVDAVVPVLPDEARALAKAIGKVQNLLGDHQDAAVAADTWLSIARTDPDDHLLAVTAGRLAERERTTIRGLRHHFPDVWAHAGDPKLSRWLP
jgi:CHAD domain-containing protein